MLGLAFMEQFTSTLQQCESESDLAETCQWIADQYAVEHYSYCIYRPLKKKFSHFRNVPKRWLIEYDQKQYANFDPVIRHCAAQTAPVIWNDMHIPVGKAGNQERIVRQHAVNFDLGNGVSLPSHGPGSELSILSFAFPDDARKFVQAYKKELQYIASSLHRKVKTIRLDDAKVSNVEPPPHLTYREVQCIYWSAQGKSSAEISKILHITESTVTFHLRNASEKLGASNRAEAVFKAWTRGEISLF